MDQKHRYHFSFGQNSNAFFFSEFAKITWFGYNCTSIKWFLKWKTNIRKPVEMIFETPCGFFAIALMIDWLLDKLFFAIPEPIRRKNIPQLTWVALFLNDVPIVQRTTYIQFIIREFKVLNLCMCINICYKFVCVVMRFNWMFSSMKTLFNLWKFDIIRIEATGSIWHIHIQWRRLI